MKKKLSIVIFAFGVLTLVFAQNDLQVIAQVKVVKTEPITLGQLKKMIKGFETVANRKLTVDERKNVLDGLLGQRLLAQFGEKEGIRVLDSEVNEYFNNFLSQQVGEYTTEAEFAKVIKKEHNQSLDEFFRANTGNGVAEAKKMLKDEIMIQKFVMSKKLDEIKSMSTPSDADIRKDYELHKQEFFRPDTLKLVIIGVMKEGNDKKETEKINSLNSKVKKDLKNLASIQKNAEKEGYVCQERYAIKNALGAKALGLQLEALLQIFEKNVNFVSDITDMPDNKQFFVITEKYDAKILNLSDVIDPAQTITVYEFVKQKLSAEMQTMALQKANLDLIKELRTDENVKLLKEGEALNKILNW